MNKKKILVLAMALSMVAILAIGGSIAYFTAEDNAENVFTVGNVEIDLTEPNWEAQGEDEAADAYPGEALAKDPTVENTGARFTVILLPHNIVVILYLHNLIACTHKNALIAHLCLTFFGRIKTLLQNIIEINRSRIGLS